MTFDQLKAMTFWHLTEPQQQALSSSYETVTDAAEAFDGLTNRERWDAYCRVRDCDGSYENERRRIEAKTCLATATAFTSLSDSTRTGSLPAADRPEHDRHLALVPASSIEVKPVRWLWEQRIPLGELTLLAGREGIGKSAIAFTLAAYITTGNLEGRFLGEPRPVLVAATEDSWEHTIVPRLMAAGADLDRVFRVDVVPELGTCGSNLTLPSDLAELANAVKSVNAALILLDPLMSRLSDRLDTHKDAEVRRALEPLKALASAAGIAVLGIIHVNKSGDPDTLNSIMGSRAFSAVARAVLFAVAGPDADGTCLLGFEKNNLGKKDQTLTYRIEGELVAETADGPVWTGKVKWLGESDRSVREVFAATFEGGTETKSAVDEAASWLSDYLASVGGSKESSIVKSAGSEAGHTERNLQRAAKKMRLRVESAGYPRRTVWSLSTEGAMRRSDDFMETCATVTTVATGLK